MIDKFIIPTPMFNVIIEGKVYNVNEYTLRNLQLAVKLKEITLLVKVEDSNGEFIKIESDGRLSHPFTDGRYKTIASLMSSLLIGKRSII